MYADLTPLTSTNENSRLSSPARKSIPSFQAFFPSSAGSVALWGFVIGEISKWRFKAVCTLHDFKPPVFNIYHTTCEERVCVRFMIIAVVKVKQLQRLKAATEDSACYNVTFPAVLFTEHELHDTERSL